MTTVVYGYFAALTVAPFVRDLAQAAGIANHGNAAAPQAAGRVLFESDAPIGITGTDQVPVAVELAFRHGGELRGVEVPAAQVGVHQSHHGFHDLAACVAQGRDAVNRFLYHARIVGPHPR